MLLSEFFVKDFSNQTATMLLHFSVLLPCWVRTAESKFWFSSLLLLPPVVEDGHLVHWQWEGFSTRIELFQPESNNNKNTKTFPLLLEIDLRKMFVCFRSSFFPNLPATFWIFLLLLGGDGDVGGGRLFHPVLLPLLAFCCRIDFDDDTHPFWPCRWHCCYYWCLCWPR